MKAPVTQPLLDAFEILEQNPPSFGKGPPRNDAFLQIGHFLEDHTRKSGSCDLKAIPCPLWPILHKRTVQALYEADTTQLCRNEVKLWQMYNSGVLIKSDEILMGFDILPMPRFFGWEEPRGLTEKIAGLLDMLFITHRHEDHFDKALVSACLRMGKPVMMPALAVKAWGYDPNLYAVRNNWRMELDDLSIRARQGYHVWRDSIGDVELVYYEVVCQEGYTFIFGGDVDYTKDFEKSPGCEVDLCFLPWRNPNEEYEAGHPKQKGTTEDAALIAIDRVSPRRIIYEHCGELNHVYDGFSPSFDIALNLKNKLPVQSELLFWGESIPLTP